MEIASKEYVDKHSVCDPNYRVLRAGLSGKKQEAALFLQPAEFNGQWMSAGFEGTITQKFGGGLNCL